MLATTEMIIGAERKTKTLGCANSGDAKSIPKGGGVTSQRECAKGGADQVIRITGQGRGVKGNAGGSMIPSV